MFKSKQRLFRRRSRWEWIEENGYIVVALLALVGGAAGWISLFDGEHPQSEYATAELIAGSDPGDLTAPAPSEPSTADTPPPPATPDTAEPASVVETKPTAADPTPPSIDTAPPVIAAETKPSPPATRPASRPARSALASNGRRTQQWSGNAKARPLKRASRRGRSSFSLAAVQRRQPSERRPRATARPRIQASPTPAPPRPLEDVDELDHAYIAPPRSEKLRQPPAVVQPSPRNEVRHASTGAAETRTAECTRFFHAFGSTRRVQGECPTGNASN